MTTLLMTMLTVSFTYRLLFLSITNRFCGQSHNLLTLSPPFLLNSHSFSPPPLSLLWVPCFSTDHHCGIYFSIVLGHSGAVGLSYLDSDWTLTRTRLLISRFCSLKLGLGLQTGLSLDGIACMLASRG